MPTPKKKTGPHKGRYILNGKPYDSYDLAAAYASKKNWRITNTETIRKGVYLLTVSGT